MQPPKHRAGSPRILLETSDVLAIDKPSGLLTIPDRFDAGIPSLRTWLDGQLGQVFLVHRIDRETSGALLFAKNKDAQRYLTKQFEERRVEKKYLGLVEGSPQVNTGRIEKPIAEHPGIKGKMIVHRKGKPAITTFRVLESFGRYSWLEFSIETGRTHQIRVHMHDAGHPLVCDPLYGQKIPLRLSSIKKSYKASVLQEEEKPLLDRLALHAWQIGFTDMEGRSILVEAPLPKDLQATLQQLRKWSGQSVSKAD